MLKKKIGIIRGGQGEHYEKSLIKGGDLMSFIFDKLYPKWIPVDLFIDKNGVWHVGGLPILPTNLVNKVDVVWNTVPYVSALINNLGIPKIETEIFHHLLEERRDKLREHMQTLNINMPRSIMLTSYLSSDGSVDEYAIKKAREVFGKFSPPWIVRSLSSKYSMDNSIAKTFPELVNAIINRVEHKENILVEELIPGKSATIHTMSNFRGKEIYHLPLPKSFKSDEKDIITEFGEKLFRLLNAKHYLKTDLILSPGRKVSLVNISFTPDFKEDSHFSDRLKEVGTNCVYVFEHFLKETLKNKSGR